MKTIMTIEQIFIKFHIVTLKDAQGITNIKARTLKDRIIRGKLKGFKIGKTWLVLLEDIELNI